MQNKNISSNPVYLKTFTLRDIKDVSEIKNDIEKNMILIIRITPLAQKGCGRFKNCCRGSLQICK